MPTIALIDEDEHKLANISNTLEAQGYRINTYRDRAAAIDDFQVSPPDLVILDLVMPGTDGLETLRMLRKKSNVPVVFLTSSHQEIDGIISPVGPERRLLLVKPYSQQLLVERVNESLRRQQQFTVSESLVSMFHDGLIANYKILSESNSEELREAPSLEYAAAVLPGRLLEVIASRALRMQNGILENGPLCDGDVFDYGFVRELSDHVPFRIDRGTEFFAQLREDLMSHLRQGGSIAGRWGRLTLADDKIAVETNPISRPPDQLMST